MGESESEKENQRFARADRIYRLLCEAVDESPSVKDYSEYQHSPAYLYREWILNEDSWKKSIAYKKEKGLQRFVDLYKFQTSRDIVLFIQHTQSSLITWCEVSLFNIAHLLFISAEAELNKPGIEQIFDINSAQEREEAIDNAVKTTLRRLFRALPNHIFQATNKAIHDSVLSYIKTDVEHMYKHRWKSMELPKDFEYLPHEILDHLELPIKAMEDWRQRFIGNIREIPEPFLSELPAQYKELSAAYRIAKKEHRQKKEKFMATSNRRTAKEWREQWKKEFVYYPDLYADCLMMILEDEIKRPRELAYQHLSFDWGYSPDSMRRIINQQKAITRERDKKVAHRGKK